MEQDHGRCLRLFVFKGKKNPMHDLVCNCILKGDFDL